MIKIYKTTTYEKKIKKIKRMSQDSWIDLFNPTREEIDRVSEKTEINQDLISKMLDADELPRIEFDDNATLIVIDTPIITEEKEYITHPLGIIITKSNYVITVSTKNKDLIDLLNIEKTLVYFTSSLKANELVLEKLYRGTVVTLYEDDKDLLEDAVIENKQAIEMSTIYKSILKSITNTYETIASNNLNDAMKFLAGITIVLSIPTMISSFLGMNIPLGNIMTDTLGFVKIICVSLVISIILAYILKRKNML